MLDVERAGETWRATVSQQYRPNAGLASEQQTPILYGDKIISVMPKDGGARRSQLVYHSTNDLRTPVWASAAGERFGLGPYIMLGNKLFMLNDDGELFVYEVGATGMRFARRQRVMDGVDAWGPPAYADGMLVLRDAHNVVCLKIAE
jgi:outer membrane protein assembly factor BamB